MKKVFILLAASTIFFSAAFPAAAAESLNCWFPPSWKKKGADARAIATALSQESGLTIKPRIAKSYPQILEAFSSEEMAIVYVGSFVQAIIKARGLGRPLVQAISDRGFYSGVLIYPQGEDPQAILKKNPRQIAYAIGASSGESVAKAATGGKARMGVLNHRITALAVKSGKAKAGVVKNWWWEDNKVNFPGLEMYKIPGISIESNPDYILTVSGGVPADLAQKIKAAAIAGKDSFKAQRLEDFDSRWLDLSLALMNEGRIDPLTYSW